VSESPINRRDVEIADLVAHVTTKSVIPAAESSASFDSGSASRQTPIGVRSTNRHTGGRRCERVSRSL